jgi:hypothetical protein
VNYKITFQASTEDEKHPRHHFGFFGRLLQLPVKQPRCFIFFLGETENLTGHFKFHGVRQLSR